MFYIIATHLKVYALKRPDTAEEINSMQKIAPVRNLGLGLSIYSSIAMQLIGKKMSLMRAKHFVNLRQRFATSWWMNFFVCSSAQSCKHLERSKGRVLQKVSTALEQSSRL